MSEDLSAKDERKAIVAYLNFCATNYKKNGDGHIAREIDWLAECVERGGHHVKARAS